jgi:hypothetical protein
MIVLFCALLNCFYKITLYFYIFNYLLIFFLIIFHRPSSSIARSTASASSSVAWMRGAVAFAARG